MSYFSATELKCKCKTCGGDLKFDEDFLEKLNEIRENCGFALPVTSGYRCEYHPAEAGKTAVGAHRQGKAVDIHVYGERAITLLEVALRLGVKRIGIAQKGPIESRFIHLDVADDLPSPALWSY